MILLHRRLLATNDYGLSIATAAASSRSGHNFLRRKDARVQECTAQEHMSCYLPGSQARSWGGSGKVHNRFARSRFLGSRLHAANFRFEHLITTTFLLSRISLPHLLQIAEGMALCLLNLVSKVGARAFFLTSLASLLPPSGSVDHGRKVYMAEYLSWMSVHPFPLTPTPWSSFVSSSPIFCPSLTSCFCLFGTRVLLDFLFRLACFYQADET